MEMRLTRTPRQDCVELFRDDLRTGSGASGFPSGERGIGTAESTGRTAQMITVPTKETCSLCGRKEQEQSPIGKDLIRIRGIFGADLRRLTKTLCNPIN